jgi:hypothetical protein
MSDELIAAKLETISKGLETVQAKVENQKPRENWRTTLTQVIGIPAALLLLYSQFHQAKNTPLETRKLGAETRKLELEADALQAGQDLKALLNQAVVSGKNVVAYRQQLTEASEKLNSALTQLQIAKQNEKLLSSKEGLIAKYLILYVFFFAVSICFRTINALWYPFVNILQTAAFSPSKRGRFYIRCERMRRLLQTFSQILYPLPNIAEIAVDVLVMAVVLIPLFDLTATSLGQNIKFSTVYHELIGAHIGNAVNLIKQIITAG